MNEDKMKKLFENSLKVFIERVAKHHRVSVKQLVKVSNNDDEVRKELEEMFLTCVKDSISMNESNKAVN